MATKTTYASVATKDDTEKSESLININTQRESITTGDDGDTHPEQVEMIAKSTSTDTEPTIVSPVATKFKAQALDTKKPATLSSSIFNLSNTAVGAGILALPYATSQVGWGLGLVLFIGCAIMTGFTLHINSMVAQIYRPQSSYKVLCDASIKYLSYFADFIIALNTFGACCAYLIIVGQLWPDIIRHFGSDYHPALYQRQLWIAIFFVIFLLPCIYWRKLDALRHVSAVGMLCYVYITLLVLSYAIIGIDPAEHANATEKGSITAKPLAPLNFFKVLPMFIFAYGCLMNTFPIVNELENCTDKRIDSIISISMSFVFVLYITMGLSGYFSFGSNCPDNLLMAYPTDLTEFLIARILLSLCVTFSYPVLFSPCRHCLASLFCCRKNANKGELETWKFILLTTFIWVLTLAVSMNVTSLGLLIAVDGAIAITAMTLVFPGLFYWFVRDNKLLLADPLYPCKKYVSIILTVIGLILIPFCVAMIFVTV